MCMLKFVVTFSSPIGKENVTTIYFRRNIMLKFVVTFLSPIGKKNVTTIYF